MKKIIALALILTFVLNMGNVSIQGVVSSKNDAKAQTLYDLDLFSGRTGTGTLEDFDLLGNTNRQEAMKMIVVMLGLPLITNKECPFSDVDAWAQPYVTTAYFAGITKGIIEPMSAKKGIFGAKNSITGRMYATWLLRALGYSAEESWNNTPFLTTETGLLNMEEAADMVENIAKKQEPFLLRDDLVYYSYNALNAKQLNTSKKLIEKLFEDQKLTAKGSANAIKLGFIISELKVESVSVVSLKEIEIKFNQVLEDKYLKVDYYNVISDSLHNPITKIVKSNQSVFLTLGTPIKKQGSITVRVFKEIGLTTEYVNTLSNIIDAKAPTIEGVTFVGPKKMEIKVSEPLEAKTIGSVLLNNGSLATGGIEIKEKSIFVDIPNKLAPGNYDLKLMGFADYAGLAITNPIQTITYAPIVQTITAISEPTVDRNAVLITFNVNIATTLTPDYFYHYSDLLKPDSVTKINDKTYKLQFTTFPFKVGIEQLTIKNKVGDKYLEDEWGNPLADALTLNITVTEDMVAPKITATEQADDKSMKITFSEEMYGPFVENKASYQILNAEGKVVTGDFNIKYTKDYATKQYFVELKFNTRLADGIYKIKLLGFVDVSMNKNVLIENEVNFLVKDIVAPTISKVEWVQTASYQYIYVTYSENMTFTGNESILNKDNYRYNNEKLPYEAVIETFQGLDQVKIILPSTFVVKANLDTLTGSYVKDAQGNVMQSMAKIVTDGTSVKPKIISGYSTSLNTFDIIIDSKISQVIANAFRYKLSAAGIEYTPAMIGIAYKDNTTIVTLTTPQNAGLADGNALPYSVSILTGTLVDYKSVPVDSAPFTAFTDKIGPNYVANSLVYTPVASEVLNLLMNVSFDENLTTKAGVDPSFGSFDFEIKVNGKTLVPINDYTTLISGKIISIQLKTGGTLTKIAKGDNVSIQLVSTPHYIVDASGNVVKGLSLVETIK